MSEQEIIKNNKLVAEFMGAKMIVENYHGINIIEFPDKSTKDLFGLKYHSSLDWIMPVLDKIRSSGVNWEIGTPRIPEENPYRIYHYCKIGDMSTVEGVSVMDAVWGAVIEFIKLHNKNENN